MKCRAKHAAHTAARLIVCLAVTFAALLFSGVCFAAEYDDYDFYIKNYDVQVNVNDDRSYDVTETLDVYFNEERHGITRNIPLYASAEREVRLLDVDVIGAPFEYDGYGYLKIGDPDETVTGDQTYIIKYTLWHYDDEQPDADYMYFNIIGTDTAVPIQHVHSDITLPGEPLEITLNDGSAGNIGATNSKYEAAGKHITVDTLETLEPYTAVTIDVKLPQGTFANAEVWKPALVIHEMDFKYVMDAYGVVTGTQKYNVTVNHEYSLWPDLNESVSGCADSKLLSGVLTMPNGETKEFSYSPRVDLSDYVGQTVSFTLEYTAAHDVLSSNNLWTEFPVWQGDSELVLEKLNVKAELPFECENAAVADDIDDDVPDVDDNFSTTVRGKTVKSTYIGSGEQRHSVSLVTNFRKAPFLRQGGARDYIVPGVALFALLAIIAASLINRPRPLVKPVEYYPPDGIDPAAVGLVVDNLVTNKEMVSLIYYWASRGCIKINMQEHNKFHLTKLRELPEGSHDYERTMFNKLWSLGGGSSVSSSQLEDKYYSAVSDAKDQLKKHYVGKWALDNRASGVISAVSGCLLPMLCGMAAITAAFSTMFGGGEMIIAVMLALPCAFGVQLMTRKMFGNGYIGASKVGTAIRIIIMSLMFFLGWLMFTAFGRGQALSFGSAAITGLALMLCAALAPLIHKRTEYGNSLLERVLGFRMFLKTAEKHQLEMLLEQDPDYYYNVLPYAQVLGVSKKWSRKFDGLISEPPSWCESTTVAPFMLYDSMTRSMTRTMSSSPSTGGSGGGFSSGGGFFSGGSSGGGSGGGGVGSW